MSAQLTMPQGIVKLPARIYPEEGRPSPDEGSQMRFLVPSFDGTQNDMGGLYAG